MTEEGPLVDAHFHLWKADHPLTDTAWQRPAYDASTEDLLATHDRHGVLFGVVAAVSFHGAYRDYVRAALKQHRRLRATAVLPPTTDIYTMERMRDEGFVGVRLMRSLHDNLAPLDSDDYRVFFRRVADLGWHVHLVDKPHQYAESIAAVEKAGAKLVIDHMGHILSDEGLNDPGFKAILAAVERGNTWVKISDRFRAKSLEAGNAFAAQILRVGGTERALWGSDWPFAAFENKVTYDSVLADYYDIVPDARMRREIDRTALKFYFG